LEICFNNEVVLFKNPDSAVVPMRLGVLIAPKYGILFHHWSVYLS